MITEEEAFWAGIAVAVMMLGGGFSMLFLQAFTGFGAVVLALGLMTMALTIQMRAKSVEQFEPPYESQVLTSTPPIESSRETGETGQSANDSNKEPTEEVKPSEPAKHVEPTSESTQPAKPIEPPEPTQPVEQPSQPQAPAEEKTEPPKIEEKPKEEPLAVPAAS